MFAEVLLPLPIQGFFTYAIPAQLQERAKPGHRVIVPFGRRKFHTGIIVGLTLQPPSGNFAIKELEQVLDDEPVIVFPQLKFWQWIADYYLCSAGDVYRAAVPAGLRIESETFVVADDSYEPLDDETPLSEEETMTLAQLRHHGKRMSLAELERIAVTSRSGSVVASLMARGAVRIAEQLVERYRPRRETYVEVAVPRHDSDALHAVFDSLKGSPRQEKAFITLLEMSGFMRREGELNAVSRAALQQRAEVSPAIIGALVKRGFVRIVTRTYSHFEASDDDGNAPLPTLSQAQQRALDAVNLSWLDHKVTLLRGVTSSGKTEVYMHLIAQTLKRGRQVLYLVPEIALTTQLTRRLQRVFGSRVIIYHSKYSDNERVDRWRAMLQHREPCVVIGARSSVFLPFASLGLVVVDEEHETSFKQQDPAPRYNARDAAIVLAWMHGAYTLLGSATPSIDTYYKATTERYGLVELTERYGDATLPEIQLIDMARERQRTGRRALFSGALTELVNKAVADGRQAILFLNRRGYAPIQRCKMCAHVVICSHCDVSLTFHRATNKMVCHYCGATYEPLVLCPQCREPSLEITGWGTERVEEETAEAFPGARVLRMDLDTTRNKDGYQRLINDFSQHRADILVGTQMVTKGLDFEHVTVVGVVNADALIHQPDFRASERAFNMLTQVSGRAGRRTDTPGLVAIQTYEPDAPLFQHLVAHDYVEFYNREVAERCAFNYPPFSRLVYLYIKHGDAAAADTVAADYANELRTLFGARVSGPDHPPVARANSLYIRRLILKIEPEASITKVKSTLRALYERLAAARRLQGATVYYDVDPS